MAPLEQHDARLAALAWLGYVASTVVRVWYVLFLHHPRHHVTSDAVSLIDLAARFVAAPGSQIISDTIWPPGTSVWLAIAMAFDPTLGLAAWAQVIMGALVPLLVAHTTYVALGRRPALVALIFASLHFGFIHYGGFFLSEQPFQFAVAVAVWLNVVALRRIEEVERLASSRRRLAAAALLGAGCGAAWAFATSFRPNAMPIALFVGAALALQASLERRVCRVQMLAAGLLAFALALAPLAVRCSSLKGSGFCPVSSNLAMNMALGQSGEVSGLEFKSDIAGQTTGWTPPALLQHGYSGAGTVPTSIYDTTGVLRWVAHRFLTEPGRFLLRVAGNALDLFQMQYWPEDRGISDERLVTVVKQIFLLLVIAPSLVALAGGARAAWRARRLSPITCFVLSVVVALLATAAMSMGEARYRVPFDGVLILGAASFGARGRGAFEAASAPAAPRPWVFAVTATMTIVGVVVVGVVASPHAAGLARVASHLPSARTTIVRPVTDFGAPRQAGSAWDAPGNFVFSCDPTCPELKLTYSARAQAAFFELSLDNNDRYRIVFYAAGRALADVDIDPRPTAPGIRIETRPVPAAAFAAGFDAIGVRPLYGDGAYSLGHLRLVAASGATASAWLP
ncbi:MAG TPA: hypothetical protein VH560_08540 [Polyangia bacterium]|nr:hypothetical protein [Polyangia bacterium]